MKNKKTAIALAAKVMGGAIVMAVFLFNVLVFVQKDAKSNDLSLATLKAYADAAPEPIDATKKYSPQTYTSQQLIITEVTGQAALNAGLKTGMALDVNLSAQIKAGVKAVLKDCYSITCFDGGKCNCLGFGWTTCASTGCPSAGPKSGC